MTIKNKDNYNLKLKVLTYLILFMFLYGVTNVYVYYENLMPFGIGFVFALFYKKYNGYYLSITYLFAYMLSGMMWINIIEGLNVVTVLVVAQILLDRKILTLSKWNVFILAIMSESIFVFVNLGSGKENLALLVSVVISMIFLYTSICFLDGVERRGISNKLSIDEKICGSLMVIIFIMGMAYTNIYIINLGMILSALLILISVQVYSISGCVFVGSLIGISYAIVTSNCLYLSLFVVLSLVAIIFQKTYRVISIVSICLVYLGFVIIFEYGIVWGECISLGLGGVMFLFLPKKNYEKLRMLSIDDNKLLLIDMVNNMKNQIRYRVNELSSIFKEMESIYKDMVRGNLPDDIAKEMIRDELISNVCKNCANYKMCFRKDGSFTENSFNTLIDIGYEKNKVLLIDLPQYLSINCVNIGGVLDNLNCMLNSYSNYSKAISNLDTSRILIADQLSGVSSLLSGLSEEISIDLKSDNSLAKRIAEELEYKGVVCYDCYVYLKGDDGVVINIIVKNNGEYDNKIIKCVNKILNTKTLIKDRKSSDMQGYDVVTLVNAPKYNIVYGYATTKKINKKVSGDSYSIIEVDKGKYLISICDGMGSGDRANKISKLTISLIEKFYKGGFDSKIILNTINKLLTLSEEENYSTIDLCVVDSNKNSYDFIKLGGCKSYILRENGDVEIIDSSGLPVGIIEEIKPHITRKLISPLDRVIFLSDGVADILGDDIVGIIRHCDSANPQKISDTILNFALIKCGNVSNDDMTVVCIKSVLFS